MKAFLRFFFRLLYHQFAFTYDLVAATVSFNRWKNWVVSVVPLIEGTRILEIGHGPGHLQRVLLDRGLVAVGIDESAQMGRLAKRNLTRQLLSRVQDLSASSLDSAYTQFNLTRGVAQRLPFQSEVFETVVATFPTEYITDPQTLSEAKRCLLPGGRLIVLPVALPKNRFLDWLFKVTHQRPTEALEVIHSRLKEPFLLAGFETEVKTLDAKSGILILVLATNSPH
ncbi:MAG TPA: methyltransferase domain-containing protein [Anaerolineales bacterium]|nr:methyltransferase domain-containing protein [Anaerolineales bacterium]